MTAPSIAVLPFTDRSTDGDQQYFCDGLTRELIAALMHIEGLRVATRGASFRLRGVDDPREAGRKLGVSAVFQGSVAKAHRRLRIRVRLTSAADGGELWSRAFDQPLDDIFAIQREMAETIAYKLELRLHERQGRAFERPPTIDVQAYEYYLMGRQRFFEYRRRGVETALQLFNMASMLDHEYALAYAGIAECCTFLYMYADGDGTDLEQADVASRRALELAPELAEAHVARGLLLSLRERFAESEEAFEAAIGRNPRLFEAYYFYARNQFVQGDLESAAKLFGHASRIDPDDYQAPLLVAQIYDGQGRADDATASRRRGIRAVERRLEHSPREARALYMGANASVCLGDVDKGLRWAERALELEPDEPMVLYNVACVYSLAGKAEPALDCLERSVRGREAYIDWLRQDSNLDAIRDHPRFQALL